MEEEALVFLGRKEGKKEGLDVDVVVDVDVVSDVNVGGLSNAEEIERRKEKQKRTATEKNMDVIVCLPFSLSSCRLFLEMK